MISIAINIPPPLFLCLYFLCYRWARRVTFGRGSVLKLLSALPSFLQNSNCWTPCAMPGTYDALDPYNPASAATGATRGMGLTAGYRWAPQMWLLPASHSSSVHGQPSSRQQVPKSLSLGHHGQCIRRGVGKEGWWSPTREAGWTSNSSQTQGVLPQVR